MREEIEPAGIGAVIHQAPSLDATSSEEIALAEIRVGIASRARRSTRRAVAGDTR